MTISSTTTTVSYTGNASTVAFPVTYAFNGTTTTAELTVVSRVIATGVETTLTNVTHYSVSGGNGSTGTVTAATAPAATVEWHIRRNTTQTQGTDYVENDVFPASVHESALDRLTMINQEQNTDLDLAFKYPDTYTGGASVTFPEPVAGGFITFNAAANALTTSTTAAGQWLGGNGTVSLPYYTFSSDPDTGLYRIGANNIGVATNGVKQVDITTSGVAVTGTISGTAITGSGVLSIDDTTTSTSGTTGSIHTDGGLGVAGNAFVAGTAKIVGVATHGGDVLSDTDSTDSIGSNAVRWLKGWFDSLVTTGNIDVAGNLTVTGDLTVNGTTTNVDTTNMVVSDTLIKINDGASSNINDMGLLMERGSTGDNVFVGWDESGDYFAVGTTTADGDTTGNISYTLAQARLAGLNLSGTSADLGAVTTIDINGGTVDGTVVGGASAAAGTFTTLGGTAISASTSLSLATGATVTGILDEDAMGTNSATQLATQQSIKAYVDGSVPENGIKFAFESTTTDADQGVGKVWLNHATPSSATVLYIDDVEAGGVSVNAWADSMDNSVNATARGVIYIASYGTTNALLVFNVTGAVTSASTYSKVAVTHVLTVGTISDGDSIGVTFVAAGADGTGDVVGPSSATDNAVARYNTTTGKLLQNSGVTIDDSGNLAATSLNGILGSGTPAAATVTTIDASGVATATTFEPDGDTSAGDNAAMGYTSVLGAILTGQGSTNDVTLVNDADATVLSIPTGTTNVAITGDITANNFAGRNLIINGDMAIAQRGTSIVTPTNTVYLLDRYKYFISGTTAAVTVTQDSDMPAGHVGFSMKFDCTTADASVAAGDVAGFHYYVEGFDSAHLAAGTAAAKTITISFWVKSPKTGGHGVIVKNGANNRAYPASYTVSVADTWEYKTMTVAMDTSGTWIGATNGIGLGLYFPLIAGSNFTDPADAWVAAECYGINSGVNILDNAANNFYLTELQVEVGTAATEFERIPYEVLLAKCQRYLPMFEFDTTDNMTGFVGQNVSTTVALIGVPFPVKTRVKPTGVTVSGAAHFSLTQAGSGRVASTAVAVQTVSGRLAGALNITVGSGLIAGEATTLWSNSAGAKFYFTGCEL